MTRGDVVRNVRRSSVDYLFEGTVLLNPFMVNNTNFSGMCVLVAVTKTDGVNTRTYQVVWSVKDIKRSN